MRPIVAPGTYRHFKGNLYEVIGVARDVNTGEDYVIYRPLYGDGGLAARPLAEFAGTVRQGLSEEPRFRLIGEQSGACRCRVEDHGSKSF